MTTQQVLFYAGIAFIAVGLLLIARAVYLYFSCNILDILDDLSGKKRADAIAAMGGESDARRRGSFRKERKVTERSAAADVAVGEAKAAAGEAAQVDQDATQDMAVDVPLGSDAQGVPTSLLRRDARAESQGDSAATEDLSAAAEKGSVATFEIVRKIVLTESVCYVKVEQGGSHAQE